MAENSGQIKPGEVRNPTGRPKGSSYRRHFLDLIDRHEAIDKCTNYLLAVLEGKEKNKLKLDAAKYLLEQAMGKAPQSISHTGEDESPIVLKVLYVNSN